MNREYDYHKGKQTDRVYLSKSLSDVFWARTEEGEIKARSRKFRFISKVIDGEEQHGFVKDGMEIVLRITPGGRQEITAKFYEDDRGVFSLQIQRFTVETGSPHKTHFTFIGEEIGVLYNFLRNIAVVPLRSEWGDKLDDAFVNELVLSAEATAKLIAEKPELLQEILKNDTSAWEIAELGARKAQLTKFRQLLDDPEFFESARLDLGENTKSESVWQAFFENNTWIFGIGLNIVFNQPLKGRKLEQVVKGSDFNSVGKRVDGLLKSAGIISSLSFGEIKTHNTKLLDKKTYRSGSWPISSELSGGIAQIHKTVQLSLTNLKERTDVVDSDGIPTGEQLYLYTPKSYLVIGSLSEFETVNGINESKFSSFELFIKNIKEPEIITFDELYERAKFIVTSSESF